MAIYQRLNDLAQIMPFRQTVVNMVNHGKQILNTAINPGWVLIVVFVFKS